MGEGFIMLATQPHPNGSIMRVTVRARGTKVVHDLLDYGRELGGEARARDGILVKESPLEPLSQAEAQQLDEGNLAGRSHEGMDARVAKL